MSKRKFSTEDALNEILADSDSGESDFELDSDSESEHDDEAMDMDISDEEGKLIDIIFILFSVQQHDYYVYESYFHIW